MMTVRWGVVGVGRAGNARVKALHADPRSTVIGGWRGDPESAGLHAFQGFDELLQHVDAVAICSPDPFHSTQVHAALSAYRHVVCEFPLAGSAGEASSLFALSVARDRVLHVEHIELLTPASAWIRVFCSSPLARSSAASAIRSDRMRLNTACDVASGRSVRPIRTSVTSTPNSGA